MDDTGKSPIIVLKDVDESRVLPIWIGPLEASSISVALNKVPFDRPMTHDLMLNVIRNMGGTLKRIEVIEIDGGTFYAELVLETESGTMRVDSRPSDAIAIAVREECPMYVASEVFEKAGAPYPEEQQTVLSAEDSDNWLEELEKLDEDDTKYKM